MNRFQRWSLWVVAIVSLMSLPFIVRAVTLSYGPDSEGSSYGTLAPGQKVSASGLWRNFSDLASAVTALEVRATALEASAGTHSAVDAWSVTSNGAVGPNQASWITIPGLSLAIDLANPATLQLNVSGRQRTTNLNADATVFCHSGYRYVIDGTGRGTPDWGQAIVLNNGAYSYHATWSIADQVFLPAGRHLIEVQTRHPGETAAGSCSSCGDWDGTAGAYDSCTLNVLAVARAK